VGFIGEHHGPCQKSQRTGAGPELN
jgi:hypothetical protein